MAIRRVICPGHNEWTISLSESMPLRSLKLSAYSVIRTISLPKRWAETEKSWTNEAYGISRFPYKASPKTDYRKTDMRKRASRKRRQATNRVCCQLSSTVIRWLVRGMFYIRVPPHFECSFNFVERSPFNCYLLNELVLSRARSFSLHYHYFNYLFQKSSSISYKV